MKNKLVKQVEYYNNTKIVFIKDENNNVWINATDIAKNFGKRPIDYLKQDINKRYINRRAELMVNINGEFVSRNTLILGKNQSDYNNFDDNQRVTYDDLVFTFRGGVSPKTIFHKKLLIDFAQYLDIDFKIWCDDIIEKLFIQGQVNLNVELELLHKENNDLKDSNKVLNHFGNILINSLETTSINEFSAELDMTVQTLMDYLRETNRIQKFKDKPYQKEIDNGNFKYKRQILNGRLVPTIKITPKLQLKLYEEIL